MKKITTILLLLISWSFAQNKFNVKGTGQVNNFGNSIFEAGNTKIIVEENARINNSGTIKVNDKNDVSQQAVGVEFYGIVENVNGFIDLNYYGNSIITQELLNGTVAFSSQINDPNGRQFVPLIQYDSVLFSGTRKTLRLNTGSTRTKLVARKNFTSTNNTFEYDNNVEIESHKHTEHDGTFETSFDRVTFIQGSDSLDARVNGTGNFKVLRIDNPNGVDITRGGFEVQNRLELYQGKLNNSASANFILADSSTIELPANFNMMDESGIYREAASSLNIEPEFDGTVLVQYQGNAPMESGPEIPADNQILTDLNILNNGGVTFTKDVFVRDRIEIGANAYMDYAGNENTLYYLSPDDSGIFFSDTTKEVYGNMARANANLPTDSRLTFNNAYTYLRFSTEDQDADPDLTSDGGLVDTIIVRVEPNTAYDDLTYGNDSDLKVQRKIKISAKDNSGTELIAFNNASFGYAWRHDADSPKANYHETRDDNSEIIFDELGLQRFDIQSQVWLDEQSQIPPNYDDINDWAYSNASLSGLLGEFAIGLNIKKYLAFVANAILEGPYDLESGQMIDSLQQQDLFPKDQNGKYILPNSYPFETAWIPNELRITLDSIPENVVDWVLIEFRKGQEESTESFYKPCFLRKDGVLIDTVGNENIIVWEEEVGGIDVSGETTYYIAIHHRNHMPIVTNEKLKFSSNEDNPELVDFTNLNSIYNFALSPVKFLGLDENNERIYGLYAGNTERTVEQIDFRQIINQADLDEINDWIKRDNYLLYLRADINMDGIVNAKDFNVSWNNQKNRYVDSFVK
ncbi:hypothetical protein OAQ99_00555 [Candidatus Kapabacteria bacterium]|nr:hypothetical protein [Candidatus Kapabacteria bacterium]